MAAPRAHCPYSNFHGRAAENFSYRLTICAESFALFTAISQVKRPIELALSCVNAQSDTSPASRIPCAACRQVMQELLPLEARIHIDGVGHRLLKQVLPEGSQLE